MTAIISWLDSAAQRELSSFARIIEVSRRDSQDQDNWSELDQSESVLRVKETI